MTIIVCKFEAAPVDITLDLGTAGQFVASGTSQITLSLTPGDVFPDIPAWTPDPAWVLEGFDTPAFVPAQATTYHARVVSSAVRIIHLVPEAEAPAVQDGASWATAYTNLATAYADAGATGARSGSEGASSSAPRSDDTQRTVAAACLTTRPQYGGSCKQPHHSHRRQERR